MNKKGLKPFGVQESRLKLPVKADYIEAVLEYLYLDFLSLCDFLITGMVTRSLRRNINLGEKHTFCWRLESHRRKDQDPDPEHCFYMQVLVCFFGLKRLQTLQQTVMFLKTLCCSGEPTKAAGEGGPY
jgi:hypothetical protein